MAIVNHGTPVVSSRQWATGLSPDAAGNGWNYIVNYGLGQIPMQWTVLRNFTTTPVEVQSETVSSIYPNTNFSYINQLRAANGRIFFLQVRGYITYYDPTDEQIHQIGPFPETPPIVQTVATQYYSATFGVDGKIYTSTQESQYRQSCLSVIDPTTNPPSVTILGYFGSGAQTYTTYGYFTAPDVGTATKFIYAVYGEDPWQLWAINVTPGDPNYGVATKLYEVPATGSIQFTNITGKGWKVSTNTNLGQPSNVANFFYAINGALEAFVAGVDPSSPRNVTPPTAPLTTPPQIDTSGGAGTFRWRANGSTGNYTSLYYTVNYAEPVTIESLASSSDGVVGNAQGYGGEFGFTQNTGLFAWNGPWTSGVSEPTVITAGGIVYWAGYPNGALYSYDPTQPWQLGNNPPATDVNPKNLGSIGLTGTQYAGIKYARNSAWSAGTGRLYVSGDRDRNGSGLGVGYCVVSNGTLAGTYSSADGSTGPVSMSSCLSAGLLVDDTNSLIIVASKNISGAGTANLYVFNQALASQAVQQPIPNQPSLGPIIGTSNSHIIAGAYVAGGVLHLFRWNVQTATLILDISTQYVGAISAWTINPADNSLWLAVNSTLVGVNPNTLLTKTADISTVAPVSYLATFGTNMYMASGATLYSMPIPSTAFTVPQIDPAVLFPSGIIGRALGPPDFFDVLISTLNELCSNLNVSTLDENLLRAAASAGKAQGIPTWYSTIVATVNSCAAVLLQPSMDANILAPSSKTGGAFSVPAFFAAVIAKVNDLINHL